MLELLKTELSNVLRSRWLVAYTALLGAAVYGLAYLAADARRTDLVLLSALVIFVPLVSILFTTMYWYSSEPFTELLMAQPISRRSLFVARALSLTASLTACLALGLLLPTMLSFGADSGVLWLFAGIASAGIVFCCLGSLIAVSVTDRLWGVGLGLAAWFYFVVVHDGLLLLILYWLRDYPLDSVGAAACALNPLATTRVALLLYFDAPLLLGHAGALVRRLADGANPLIAATVVQSVWALVPLAVAGRRFSKRDF